jgi:hypothetical protein
VTSQIDRTGGTLWSRGTGEAGALRYLRMDASRILAAARDPSFGPFEGVKQPIPAAGSCHSKMRAWLRPAPGVRTAARAPSASRLDALRPRALGAFEEFFFSRARDVYTRYDFARMNDDEFGATLGLD